MLSEESQIQGGASLFILNISKMVFLKILAYANYRLVLPRQSHTVHFKQECNSLVKKFYNELIL